MNNLEILKNAFEQIGCKTQVEKSVEGYNLLWVLGIGVGEGDYSEFTFDENYEPIIYDWDIKKYMLLKDYYKEYKNIYGE